MTFHLVTAALNAIENGYLPDAAVRHGIRRLLRQRLLAEGCGNCEEQQERFEEFLKAARNGPIAPFPEMANEQHYELPAEFFAQVLGKHLKYSCCFWPSGTQTLDEAEQLALKTTAERAGIEDGMRVLDLGCGWGSFSLWAAQRFPHCHITAVSNSAIQRRFITDRAEALGLVNLEVLVADMNQFNCGTQFDRIVSIEMFEHMRNHAELLRRIATWLRPDGKLFVHVFCHRDLAYPFEVEGEQNWMGRYFFTGGMMPSDGLLLRYQDDLSVVRQWRWNGLHYKKTCDAWLANYDARQGELTPVLEATYGSAEATKWRQRWRVFFMACGELFAFRGGNEWWVSHYLFEKRAARS